LLPDFLQNGVGPVQLTDQVIWTKWFLKSFIST